MNSFKEPEMIIDNNITVDLDVIIKEAIKHIQSQTKVTIEDYKVNDNKIDLKVNGSSESISVFKDRMNVKEDTKALACGSTYVNKIKTAISNLIKENFDTSFTISLNSLDSMGDIIFINMRVNIDVLPAQVSLTYKIYDDGFQDMSYNIWGDISKDERWSASSCTPECLVQKLKDIICYYNIKSELPEVKKN